MEPVPARLAGEVQSSPKVTGLQWGRVEVEKGLVFRDAKLYPGGAREWDWRETGTRHRPGILPADVEELIARGARVLVLSRGVLLRLRISPTTLEYCRRCGVRVHLLPTWDAVRVYNRLRLQAPVGALLHSTC
ncbi:MAG: hypothetical protein DWQ01_01560 [Planctomycetota bacterium]|nr:MAG: hypothetical protein DWQ01_01560 [Planctomycetota bacterium]